jgi:hypothetical protein
MAIGRFDAQDDVGRKVGHRQSLFREVNERIEELSAGYDVLGRVPVVCECGRDGCEERLEITRADYERLRRVATHFAVADGHEVPEVERVVDRRPGFVVVEKLGEAAAAAIRLDPRARLTRPA